ncbi:MAG: 1-(5-phosphoribosyl)-5-[(5-phosphoribosylamino)methylideneamino]imidazole-4-carboxamide isomerase [Candidatus Omnitrophica bacterium]|nr:1-(5-phosphoribosyl)-5-[(5-phosphoribosylamino)methylideneamino]imidazole-4-carboxamide isomerase [Candidatus Omnitrophota bacterium]MBU2044719.1 1-(5-phosphoribosyl)-5-[(5-phosphoribosylamino)methylideneamino]imidazole-4-carboxamide isomerase [Candidatus Omnitrophota bacterium]MBU2250741.1 1-(5-phosphoribosyl)-5-[(5-phosphoribosylamino)methylideneamino]imidazole-4-carboxamide isomerase [Candidatus Omnitrophota bacterium]MBU2473488.1 1-(5-phosphoribosyl)-5-[(5-phosphoribosylamino)methylidenea
MKIIPAIDLYQEKVVRLTKGDPNRSKTYSDDPLSIARKWQDQGAELLHLVDLSAALGQGDNSEIIKNIIDQLDIEIQVGGGIRDIKKAKKLLSLGAKRIIIGTKALDEDFLNQLLGSIDKERIAIGVDVLDSCLAINGWKEKTDFSGLDFIAYLQLKGITWVIYTDISRDGTLKGMNYQQISGLSTFSQMNFIASGGVASLEDLKQLKKSAPFLWGVIAGKALYEEKFTIPQAKALL